MELAGTSTSWSYTIGRRLPVISILFLVIFLNALGLMMLFSIGRAHSDILGGYFFRQCIWLVVALAACACAFMINPSKLREFRIPLGVIAVILMVLVLIPGIGVKINGARRWIDLGLMNMQVSDIIKPIFLLLLADYLSRNQRELTKFQKGILIPGLGIGFVFGMIILQPDFGTAFLFAIVAGAMLFLSGVSLKPFIPISLGGLVLFGIAIWQDPVRLQRIVSFLDIEGNRSTGSYQLWQGLIGFGSGGVGGVGLGNGKQQFAFLPEAHTDFIFPIIGEELGLICTVGVVLAFGAIFSIVWVQLRKAPGLFPFLLVAGCLFFILFQALINMGVATGCLPTKGMSLPFISYGGSNLVATYFLLGVILRALWQWNDPPRIQPSEIRF